MNRYARITEKMPREFLLLQGTGCFHRGCAFCDYYFDAAAEPFPENKVVLDCVTGEFGVLDIINSGSAHELDSATLNEISRVVREKKIHTLWFETHYAYRHRLSEIRTLFPHVQVHFRTGIESFDPAFRRAMNKGVPEDVTPQQVKEYFNGVCLLVCVEGQTRQSIEKDIQIAAQMFDYFSVNVFCENTTKIRRDKALTHWFVTQLYPKIKSLPNCEILMENTDLGVGELTKI